MAREELQRLTSNGNGTCGKDDCPNVYRTASGSFVVQGDVSQAFQPPEGEGLVEIPEAVLREAIRNYGTGAPVRISTVRDVRPRPAEACSSEPPARCAGRHIAAGQGHLTKPY